MAGQNLLDQRAAGTGHADDEDGHRRGIARHRKAVKQAGVERVGDPLEPLPYDLGRGIKTSNAFLSPFLISTTTSQTTLCLLQQLHMLRQLSCWLFFQTARVPKDILFSFVLAPYHPEQHAPQRPSASSGWLDCSSHLHLRNSHRHNRRCNFSTGGWRSWHSFRSIFLL